MLTDPSTTQYRAGPDFSTWAWGGGGREEGRKGQEGRRVEGKGGKTAESGIQAEGGRRA